MSTNIITAIFPSSMGSQLTYADPVYQYDYGMVLQFVGLSLPVAYEVHFANTDSTGNSITQIGNADGVSVPDELLLTGKTVYAWVYLHSDVDDGETVYKVVIPVNRRAKPTNATPTPVQQDVITEAIAALDAAVEQTAADVQTTSGFVDDARGYASAADGSSQAAAGSAGLALRYAQSASASAQTASEKASEILNLTGDATVDANTGTPSVEVTVSEVDDHKNMSFSFHNLKGERGEAGSQGIPGPTGPEGPAGPEGSPGQPGQDGISPTITVTEISGGHNVEITDAQGTTDFDVMDGEVSEAELQTALIDKADVITSNASGEIVTISDGGKDLPVVDLKVSLLPVQSGSGDPSPTNVRPISGWTGVEVYQAKKNLLSFSHMSTYSNWGNIVPVGDDGGRTNSTNFGYWLPSKPGTYTLSFDFSTTFPQYMYLCKCVNNYGTRVSFLTAESVISNPKTFIVAEGERYYIRLGSTGDSTSFATTIANVKNPQLEVGSTATAYEAFNGNTYPIDWSSSAGTVYGGSLDVTSGVLTVTYAQIASYAGETLPSTWISDRDVYAQGTTPTTGAQVVYKLATPTTYQLTPVQIQTLLGNNSFWSNSNGSIDLEYRADTKLYIEQLTKPSEDDMTANANIASGKFFMIGNRLMLSTTAIAQGEQIVVGTNCSEVSLADALNQINV